MFLYKSASGIAILLATSMLGYFGYVEGSKAPQPEAALTAIRILMGIGPGIFFLISAIFVKFLPISKERFEQVKKALEERRAAE
jgi:Na+/melibiose symporter-like transporter